MAATEEKTLSILVKARDLASRTIGRVNKSLSSIGRTARQGVATAIGNLKRLSMMGVGVATALGVGAIRFAASWESAAAGVRKTVEGDVTAILSGIQDMSRRIPIAAEELAGIAEAAGALGVAKADILGFTEVVALLGVTTDLTSESAATSLGHLRTTLGLMGQDFDRFGSALVDLGNNGASTESQILGMAEHLAGAAKLVRLSKAETLGWAAALANTGEQVEAGGSSLQRFFLSSFRQVSKGGKALAAYAKVAGVSGQRFAATMERDFSGAMETFLVGLGKLDQESQLQVLDDLGFTDVRITRALLKLAANTDNVTDSLGRSRRAWQDSSAMGEEAAKRFETFDSRVAVLRNSLKLIGVTIGTELLPPLGRAVKRFSDWLSDPEQQANLKKLAKAIGVGFDELLVKAEELAGTVDWGDLFSTLESAAKLAGGVFDKALELWNAAPAWLKELGLAAAGLNMLTGGAVAGIASELGKGLIRGVLGISAGVVNIMAGRIGGGGVAPVGAAGGRAGGLFGAVMKVTIVGMAASVAAMLAGDLIEGADERREITPKLVPMAKDKIAAIADLSPKAQLLELQRVRDELLKIRNDDMQSLLTDIADVPLIADVLGTIGQKQAREDQITALDERIAQLEATVAAGSAHETAATTSLAGRLRDVRQAITSLRFSVAVTTHVDTHVTSRDVASETTRTLIRSGYVPA